MLYRKKAASIISHTVGTNPVIFQSKIHPKGIFSLKKVIIKTEDLLHTESATKYTTALKDDSTVPQDLASLVSLLPILFKSFIKSQQDATN